MLPIIEIHIGDFEGFVYTYALCCGLGLSHLIIGVDHLARKMGFDHESTAQFLMALGLACCGGWVAGVLASQVVSNDLPLGTVTAMPGIITTIFLLVFAARFWRFSLLQYLDLVAPIWCFAHCWGRLGCFMAGCCFGIPTEGPWAVTFPDGSFAHAEHGTTGVHPTQLYEMGLLFVLGLALTYRVKPGWRVALYLLGYGVGRFIIEYFRGDLRGDLGLMPSLSPSQQTAVLFVIGGLTMLCWQRWRGAGKQGPTLPQST